MTKTTKPKHYFVDDKTFEIVASVAKSKRGYTRFDTEAKAKNYASKMRKQALEDHIRHHHTGFIDIDTAKNVIDKRDLLAFEGVKDLAKANPSTVTYRIDSIPDDTVRKIISSLGVQVESRYSGPGRVADLDTDRLFLTDNELKRFLTDEDETVTDEYGYRIGSATVSTVITCIYFAGDDYIPVKMTVRVDELSASEVERLLPESVMDKMLGL